MARSSVLGPELACTRYAPDECAPAGAFRAGDFILTQGHTWQHAFIRWGQGLRLRGKNRPFARWSHAALIVDDHGGLIEAVGSGVRRGHLDEYRLDEYHLVSVAAIADDRDRRRIVAFAETCLRQEYGLATILSIAVNLLTGSRLLISFDGEWICSGLVARALERGEVVFPRSPSHLMPGDLARFFQIKPPAKGTPVRSKQR